MNFKYIQHVSVQCATKLTFLLPNKFIKFCNVFLVFDLSNETSIMAKPINFTDFISQVIQKIESFIIKNQLFSIDDKHVLRFSMKGFGFWKPIPSSFAGEIHMIRAFLFYKQKNVETLVSLEKFSLHIQNRNKHTLTLCSKIMDQGQVNTSRKFCYVKASSSLTLYSKPCINKIKSKIFFRSMNQNEPFIHFYVYRGFLCFHFPI